MLGYHSADTSQLLCRVSLVPVYILIHCKQWRLDLILEPSQYIIIVHVRAHALVSLAASAAWPDKKRERNRRQTTNRQTGVFYRYRFDEKRGKYLVIV